MCHGCVQILTVNTKPILNNTSNILETGNAVSSLLSLFFLLFNRLVEPFPSQQMGIVEIIVGILNKALFSRFDGRIGYAK